VIFAGKKEQEKKKALELKQQDFVKN
jgi:hypothetical protein